MSHARDPYTEALLERAFAHAKTVVRPDDPRVLEANHAAFTDAEALAWGLLILNYEAIEANAVPARSYCTWCVKALGKENVTPLPLDKIEAHALVCEYSPLVNHIRRLTDLLEETKRRILTITDGIP